MILKIPITVNCGQLRSEILPRKPIIYLFQQIMCFLIFITDIKNQSHVTPWLSFVDDNCIHDIYGLDCC